MRLFTFSEHTLDTKHSNFKHIHVITLGLNSILAELFKFAQEIFYFRLQQLIFQYLNYRLKKRTIVVCSNDIYLRF